MSDDSELLEAWRGGDASAGSQLFERHFAAISRFFKNKVNREIEDLIQKTFLRCVEGKERFRGDSSFRTFLFGIAHNVLREHYRDKHKREVDFGSKSIMDINPGPSTIFAKGRGQMLLAAALRSIPFDFQIALELFYFEQMQSKDIAAVLGIPAGTARSRLRLGREKLLAAISKLAERDLGATVDDLDKWAAELRDQVFPAAN